MPTSQPAQKEEIAYRRNREAVYRKKPRKKGIGSWEIRGRAVLAHRLVELRRRSGLSAQEVCERARINPGSLSLWENQHRTASLEQLRAVANAYGIPTLTLLECLMIDEAHLAYVVEKPRTEAS